MPNVDEHSSLPPACALVDKYVKIPNKPIGEGTYGVVYRAKNRDTGQLVALKQVLVLDKKDGFPLTALREINILNSLGSGPAAIDNGRSHRQRPACSDFVVRLLEVCRSDEKLCSFYLVLELCDHDLAGLLANRSINFALSHVKTILKQLYAAVFYVHRNRIIHRDIKTSNVLLTRRGLVKLCDFGMARRIATTESAPTQKPWTSRVVTLWYRGPELLLGAKQYTTAIDMWGVGCITGEMWTRSPLFVADTEQAQIDNITNVCGSFSSHDWPSINSLPLYNKLVLKQDVKRSLDGYLSTRCTNPNLQLKNDPKALDLINKLLTLNPTTRLTAEQAMGHDYFWTEPKPNMTDFAQLMESLTKKGSHYEKTLKDQRKDRLAPRGYPKPAKLARFGDGLSADVRVDVY